MRGRSNAERDRASRERTTIRRAEIARLGSSELDDYERLLEAQDRDVFRWLTFEAETPSLYDTPVLRKIRAFHSHTGPIHT